MKVVEEGVQIVTDDAVNEILEKIGARPRGKVERMNNQVIGEFRCY